MTNLNMTNESKYLLDTIKSMLHDESMLDEQNTYGLVEIDYNKVFKLAKSNGIASMAAYRICNDNSVPEDIRKKFDLERIKITAQQIKQSNAVYELEEIFDKSQTKALLLKGSIIKDLYPNPFMRSMSDVDFFMEESDIKQIRSAITTCGFEDKSHGFIGECVFKKDVVTVEIHSNIESIGNIYGEKVFKNEFPNACSIQEVMDIWTHTEPVEGSNYTLQLTPKYHYLYIVMHMMRHFLSSGTGIRSFIDLWIMNHRYGAKWNREELNELLDRFGLLKFEQYALALTDRWFDIDTENCIETEIDNEALDSMEEYVLKSGAYGLNSNHVLTGMDHDTSKASRLKYIFRVVFQPLNKMKNLYPVLNKKPLLLPATWVHRMLDLAIIRGKQSRKKLKEVAHANQEQADKLKDLFEKVI